MDVLREYAWPGNVRELENLVRRLVALYSQENISAEVMAQELAEQQVPSVHGANGNGLAEAVEGHLHDYFSAHGGILPAAGLYNRILREVERPLISLTLEATRGNQLRAAKLLGLNRNTLRKKIRDLQIPVVRSPK